MYDDKNVNNFDINSRKITGMTNLPISTYPKTHSVKTKKKTGKNSFMKNGFQTFEKKTHLSTQCRELPNHSIKSM